jgi:hypothetical protein
MLLVRVAAVVTAGLAGIASATAVISADPPHEGPIAGRSPVSTKQVSAAINNALDSAGLDASESEKVRQAFHVGIDQIDDESDEARKALNGALGKVLPSDKVKHVDAAADHVVDKVDSLVERDLGDSAEFALYKVLASGSVRPVGAAVGHVVDKVESPVEKRDLDASAGFAPINGGVGAKKHEGMYPGIKSAEIENPNKDDIMHQMYEEIHRLEDVIKNGSHHATNTTPAAPTKCDCKRVIASVIEPKPEDGVSQAWFVEWKKAFYPKGDLSTRCIKSCVDQSIHKFIKEIKEFQAADELSNKTVAEVHAGRPHTHPSVPGGLDKREESPAVAPYANMYAKLRKWLSGGKPKPASGGSKPKMNADDIEKIRKLIANFTSPATTNAFKTTNGTKIADVPALKPLAGYMHKVFPQPDEKTLRTYRQWREAIMKFNKGLHTAKKEPVSSSGAAEEGEVLVR